MSRWWDRDDVNATVVDCHSRRARFPKARLDRLKTRLEPLLDEYIEILAEHGIQCKMEEAGSVAEGVRILHPDGTLERDVEFVMDGSSVHVTPLDQKACCIIMHPLGNRRKDQLPDSFHDTYGHVSAKLVLDVFDEAFGEVLPSWQSAFKKSGCVVYKEQGPAVTVKVNQGGRDWLSVDLVPAICVPDEGFYVPKQRPCGPKHDYGWRQSFSFEERDRYPPDLPCTKACLRILKTFCVSNEEMKKLDTYILKNILFLEMEERPHDTWDVEDVARRVLGLLARLRRGLQDGFIPQFFNRNVNLLGETSEGAMDDMRKYVNTILRQKDAFMQIFSA